eukprot:jgi/Bigna1/81144/fgenesh1_pg.77_\
MPRLKDLFMEFCRFGDKNNKGSMNGRQFRKFCADNGMIGNEEERTDCDIFFTKAVGKGKRTMTFPTFREACRKLAQGIYTGTSVENPLAEFVSHLRSPIANGTIADPVKFHDDKSLYTGVHKKGGPTTNDKAITLRTLLGRLSIAAAYRQYHSSSIQNKFNAILDRSEANARGVKLSDLKRNDVSSSAFKLAASERKTTGGRGHHNTRSPFKSASKLSSPGSKAASSSKRSSIKSIKRDRVQQQHDPKIEELLQTVASLEKQLKAAILRAESAEARAKVAEAGIKDSK